MTEAKAEVIMPITPEDPPIIYFNVESRANYGRHKITVNPKKNLSNKLWNKKIMVNPKKFMNLKKILTIMVNPKMYYVFLLKHLSFMILLYQNVQFLDDSNSCHY